MRRLILIWLTLLAGLRARSQDASVFTPPAYLTTLNNYIRSWAAVAPDTAAADFTTSMALTQALMTTQYYDGMGRPIQTVVRDGSFPTGGSSVDLVTAQVYDAYGREQRKYLPFAASSYGGNGSITDGGCKSNPFQEQQNFYSSSNGVSPINGQDETYFYGKTEFEPSPLDRPVGVYAPGDSWVHNGRGTTTGYWVNTTADSVHCWTVTSSGSPDVFSSYSGTGFYAGGELSKTITADENGNQVIEYRDRENLVVLKKVQLTAAADAGTGEGPTGWLCTYYVYDSLNLLRAVIQPAGVQLLQANSWNISALGGIILNEQCFRYEYDGRRRMTLKQVPGAAMVEMVYDARDLPVMTQDANLRAQGKWLCTMYDAIDRPVMTAFISYSGTQSQLQTLVTGQTGNYSTGSVAVSGQAQSTGTIPASYAFSTPHTGDWYASSYIDLDTGFAVSSGVEFGANIASGGTMMQSSGSTQVSNNPLPSGTTPDILTVTYYDNYNWATGTGLGTVFELPSSSEFSTSYNASPDYAQPVTANYQTQGLVTGTMTRVLGTTSQYLYTQSFYDDHHRVIQARQVNYKGEIDQQTTQYSFTGKPLRVFVQRDNTAISTDAHNVMTRISYDAEQRESAVWKNIDGAATDQRIDSMAIRCGWPAARKAPG